MPNQQSQQNNTEGSGNNNNNVGVPVAAPPASAPPLPPTTEEEEQEEEEDPSFQFAQAMALAIQNNPDLTPDEIHEIMSASTMHRSSIVANLDKHENKKTIGSILPGRRISNMFSAVTATTAADAKATTGGVNRNNSGTTSSASTTTAGRFGAGLIGGLRENAKRGFTDILKVGATSAAAVGVVSTPPPAAPTSNTVTTTTTRSISNATTVTTAATASPPSTSGKVIPVAESSSPPQLVTINEKDSSTIITSNTDVDEIRSNTVSPPLPTVASTAVREEAAEEISLMPSTDSAASSIIAVVASTSDAELTTAEKAIVDDTQETFAVPPQSHGQDVVTITASPGEKLVSSLPKVVAFVDNTTVEMTSLPEPTPPPGPISTQVPTSSTTVTMTGASEQVNVNKSMVVEMSSNHQETRQKKKISKTSGIKLVKSAFRTSPKSRASNMVTVVPAADMPLPLVDDGNNSGDDSNPFNDSNSGSLGASGALPKASVAFAKATTASSSPIVKFTGVCWKRRGGLGKYSSSAAWERRRIELQGTVLYYYSSETEAPDEIATVPSNVTASSEVESNETKKTGGAGWFAEQAAALASFNLSTLGEGVLYATTTGNPSANKPRGHIDIAKEKAGVHASMGHSGAPSPFAVSIVVKGETKWKLCFDHHKQQMEWLAAISDIVIQASVDAYNAQLLEAADPSNAVEGYTSIFRSPPHQPGYEKNIVDGDVVGRYNRLWMMDSYDLSSRNWSAGVTEERKERRHTDTLDSDDLMDDPNVVPNKDVIHEEDIIVEPQETEPLVLSSAASGTALEERDHIAAQAYAAGTAAKVWVVPEANVCYVVLTLNLSLALARASSTSIEGFWYLVVICNIIMLFCVIKQPDWRSILEHVRAEPTTAESLLRQSLNTPINGSAVGIASIAKALDTKSVGKATNKDKTQQSSRQITTEVVAPSLGPEKAQCEYIPVAGSSSVRITNETDPPVNSKNEMFAGWRSIPGDILQIRSHGYSATKEKVPSPGTLYELAAVDVFESPHRYPDMAARVKLPKVEFTGDGPDHIKTWRCPDHFVISIALPTDPPKMGRSSSDGGGYTVTIYFTMTQETRDILRRVTAEGYDPSQEDTSDPQKSKVNAVRLLEEWIRRSPTDPSFQARFKIVPNAHNLKEIGMPNWIATYNGKPFLIKRSGETGFLHLHPELSCAEFDVSLHPFPYLAKKAICILKTSYFKKVVVTFGFVIEGKADDELPECLIGLVQLCYPDPEYAIQAADFFSGKAPRSQE